MAHDADPQSEIRGVRSADLLAWAATWRFTWPTKLIAPIAGHAGRVEHVVHEVGHALTLRIALPCARLEDEIDRRIDRMRLSQARYFEAWVLAAEIWLFEALGNDVHVAALHTNADEQGCLPELVRLRGGISERWLGLRLYRWLDRGGFLERERR